MYLKKRVICSIMFSKYLFRKDISLITRTTCLRVKSGNNVVSMCTITTTPMPLPTLLLHPFSYGCNAKKTCDVILLQKNTRGGIQVCCPAPTAPRVPTSAAGPSVPPDRKNRVLPIITNVSALAASLLQGQPSSQQLAIQIVL